MDLREGDALVVWRLDRLGRFLKHLIEMVGKLEQRKIGFKSLQESIDATNSGGKLIFHMFGALAEFERNLIIERTRAGNRFGTYFLDEERKCPEIDYMIQVAED